MGNEIHEQVKKCPNCEHINDQFATFCVNPECKASLLYVDPEGMNQGRANNAAGSFSRPAAAYAPGATYRKKGVNNAAGSSSRPAVVPTTDRLEAVEEAILHCPDQPSLLFKVKSGDIVGRAGDVNISALERSNFISGQHARFFLLDGKWQIENLSKKNPTLVNGRDISTGHTYFLSNGDMIILANTVFIFRFQEGER